MCNLVRIQLANGVVDSLRELRLTYESGRNVHMGIISRSGTKWRLQPDAVLQAIRIPEFEARWRPGQTVCPFMQLGWGGL
jgi:hypothetical protein